MYKRCLYTLLISILLLFPATGQAFKFVSIQDEMALSQKIAQEFKPHVESTASCYITEIGNKLVKTIREPKYHYSFNIVKSKQLNAFCAGGGRIYMLSPMIQFANSSKDMLAFVLAHEIGHSENQHILHTMEKNIKGQLIALLLSGNKKNRFAYLSTISHVIVSRGYGFDKEHQADRCGFKYLVKAGYNPGGGAVFFQRLLIAEKDGRSLGTKVRNYIYPHPKTSYRLKEQLQLLKHYSGGVVSVAGDTVYVRNKPVITPAPVKKYSSQERAYLIAGRLARLARSRQLTNDLYLQEDYHGNKRLICAGNIIMTVTKQDSVDAIIGSLSNALLYYKNKG